MAKLIPFQPHEHRLDAFNCPHCGAYAKMHWAHGRAEWMVNGNYVELDNATCAQCSRCNMWSIWYEEEMIYPRANSVDSPNDDLPQDVIADYEEAAAILQDSPRGSAALLRLAIQKLVDSLVKGKGDLNAKIGTLVKRGLDAKIQQALDVVRVIGNESVHPGQIDLNDSPDIARRLFILVNLIGQRMITEPAEVKTLFDSLPEDKKKAIEDRDK
ncbi:MAG TPA: DUF4145 domain-containing protein [Candidatus Saccharimonadales bacterium]